MNTCEPSSDKISCADCGAIDKWKAEERIVDGLKYGVIVCTNCGKADSGFFIQEVETEKKEIDKK